MLQDLRHAVRMLARSPLFTGVAVASLALGIGATTAMYGVIDALLLRPLAVLPEPERLVTLTRPDGSGLPNEFSWMEYQLVQQESSSIFEGVAAFRSGTYRIALDDGGDTLVAQTAVVNGDYFRALGLRAQIGRLLTPEDDRNFGGHPVVVLSDALWRRRFGASPAALGGCLSLGGVSFTVIGVAPRGFRGLNFAMNPDVYVPATMRWMVNPSMDLDPARRDYFGTRSEWLVLVGRLKAGVADIQATQRLTDLSRRLPKVPRRPQDGPIALEPATAGVLYASQRAGASRFTVMLLAAAIATVLIGCVNVAGLLLARGQDRGRELGVRLALGATRTRLARQLLAEGLLLSSSAAALGLVLRAWLLATFADVVLPGHVQVATLEASLNARLAAMTVALAIVTGIAFAVAPAWQAGRLDVLSTMTHRRAAIARRRGAAAGSLLFAGQIALTLPLLVGTLLLLRSMGHALSTDFGVDLERRATVTLLGTRPGAAEAALRTFATRARSLPGVESVALAAGTGTWRSRLWTDSDEPDEKVDAYSYHVEPEASGVLGVHVQQGRWFDARDVIGAPRVTVINAALSTRLWPQGDALGRTLRLAPPDSRGDVDSQPLEVIGIVGNVRHTELGAPRPKLYLSLKQYSVQDGYPPGAVLLMTQGPAADMAAAIGREARAAAPGLAAPKIEVWTETIAAKLQVQRLGALALGLFGGVGVLLSAVGVYGLLAYAVARRIPEIGVRVALGANRRQILRLVLARGTVVIGLGLIAGSILTAWSSRLLQGLLHGVTTMDPLALAMAVIVLAAAGLVACYLPARRAAGIDPTQALRCE